MTNLQCDWHTQGPQDGMEAEFGIQYHGPGVYHSAGDSFLVTEEEGVLLKVRVYEGRNIHALAQQVAALSEYQMGGFVGVYSSR